MTKSHNNLLNIKSTQTLFSFYRKYIYFFNSHYILLQAWPSHLKKVQNESLMTANPTQMQFLINVLIIV